MADPEPTRTAECVAALRRLVAALPHDVAAVWCVGRTEEQLDEIDEAFWEAEKLLRLIDGEA